ncbi:MAG: acetyl-CoA carboxylase carboxyl transferase subunit alpha, partial [Planctomycetes bacterium]|nr:acetyl-CoA carboxylase carboxyl transferase subunit alpha [Planctomycetota bacterium]
MSEPSQSNKSVPSAGMAFERPIHELEVKLNELVELSQGTNLDLETEIGAVRQALAKQMAETYENITPWARVNVARHPDRPVTGDYVATILDDFIELHGDKVFGDDAAMLTGLARIGERRFMLIAHRKGTTIAQRLACNFGCAHPEGYRKALRKMRLAEKLRLPIVTFINTPGAYPGIGAEERGQAAAI